MRFLALMLLPIAAGAADVAPTPQFADPQRRVKLATAFPEADRIFEKYYKDRKIPGLIFGVVIDGELVHVKSFGVQNRTTNAAVTPDTAFRIASMTKSFTALAVLKLRDEGKLLLEDPVSKWIPEAGIWKYPTADTAAINVRQLLTHGAGFPEDNPWGDQQLGEPEARLTQWIREGFPFSTAPGTAYEYSNTGFALLGRIVTAASGIPYDQYLAKNILAPLGMKDSTLEPADLPAARTAVGYRLTGDVYSVEPSLGHGAFGAMGGLVTTARDMGKYVAFHLNAWPARDGVDSGPVKRSSVREMQMPWRPSNFNVAKRTDGSIRATAGSYGYGLGSSRDCNFELINGHGGGLPGFGSYMVWLPHEGVGIFAMANLTYTGPSAPAFEVIDAMRRTGALQARTFPVAPVLEETKVAIGRLWNRWDDAAANAVAADNFFKDKPVPERKKEIDELKAQVGTCQAGGVIVPGNWLRGTYRMPCERGSVDVAFTLAPTQPPKLQALRLTKVTEPNSSTLASPSPRCAP